jgi:hypothetical protein
MRLFIAGAPFAFRLPPQQTSKDTHKISLFAFVVISIYSVVKYRVLHAPPGRLWADLGLPVLPLRAFTLQTIAQRKMELNDELLA